MSLLSVDIINFMLTKLPLLDELRPQNRLKTKVFSAAYDTGSRFEIIYAVYIGYPLRKNSSGPFPWEPRSSMEEVFPAACPDTVEKRANTIGSWNLIKWFILKNGYVGVIRLIKHHYPDFAIS
jgi:hypothetical protein